MKKNINKNYKLNVDGFLDIIKGIGTQPKNSKGFDFNILDNRSLASLYIGNGIVKRYVDIIADDMVRQWITITNDVENYILTYLKKLIAKTTFKTSIINSKLFGGSLIFMIIDDGGLPNDPVNINNIKSIKKLKCFSRSEIKIDHTNYYKDPNNLNYGEPEYFTLYNKNQNSFVAHESRCLIIKGDYFPSNDISLVYGDEDFFGMSSLQPIYEDLRDLGLSQQILFQIMSKSNIDVLKLSGLMARLGNPEGEGILKKRVALFDLGKSITNTLVLDDKETFEVVSQSLAGFADLYSKLQESVTAVTGIPGTIFWGKSPGSLNATGDNEVRTYYDRIKAEQEEFLLPPLERLVKYIAYAKDSPVKQDDYYNIQFNSLWQLSEEENIKIRNMQANIDEKYINNGVYTPEEVRMSRFSSQYSIETTIDPELNISNDDNIE